MGPRQICGCHPHTCGRLNFRIGQFCDTQTRKAQTKAWEPLQTVMSTATTNIESILQEERVFPPPESFSRQAHIKSMAELEQLRAEARTDPEAFWARMAEELHWFKKWDTVLKWEPPHAEWFGGGK